MNTRENATDRLRADWNSYAMDNDEVAPDAERLHDRFGDFAVVDGEPYAIERAGWKVRNDSPELWRLVPPSESQQEDTQDNLIL